MTVVVPGRLIQSSVIGGGMPRKGAEPGPLVILNNALAGSCF